MAADPFLVHVARLRRNSGATAHEVRRGPVVLAGPLDELGIDPGRSVVPLDAEAECDITLRSFDGGIDAVGTVRAPWVGICRRCTTPVHGELSIAVRERFADAPDPRGRALPDRRRHHRSRPTGPRRHRAGPAGRPPVPGGLPGALPAVRGRPQRVRMRVRRPQGSQVG